MLVYDKSCCIERGIYIVVFFFFNDTATTEIYTLSLHDALPIFGITVTQGNRPLKNCVENTLRVLDMLDSHIPVYADRKSTRLNSSHANISYAVFCLKKKNNNISQFHYLSYSYLSLTLSSTFVYL